jgi:hypothetical protein
MTDGGAMKFSRQFKALARVALVFAGAWGILGALIGLTKGPALIGGRALSAGLTFAIAYALGGAIAGIATALLLARAESGRRVGEVATWRVVVWGVLGGMSPALLFTVLGLIARAPMAAMLPLAGMAVLGAVIGGVMSGSASAAAKAAPLGHIEADPAPHG